MALMGSYNNLAYLWSATNGKEIRRFMGHSGFVSAVEFSPDGRTALTGSYDDTARIWDITSGKEIRRFVGHSGTLESAVFSPDGQKVLTGSQDNTSRLWEAKTGKEVRRFVGYPAEFSSDGRLVMTRDRGYTMIWDTNTGKELCRLTSLPDGNLIVVTSDGRFDTNDLEIVKGAHWIVPEEPFRALPPEIFMRDYYEPRLLSRLISGEQLRPVRNVSDLNRVQPVVRIIEIKPQASELDSPTETVSVKVEVANGASAVTRGGEQITLESGVHDLRIFRDGQLVGYAPEQDGPIKLESDKATITFKDIRLPRRADLKQVEFSAYAFNVDRVKSETARQTYVLQRSLTTVKGRAYVITVGVNAYENAALDLNYAANDAQRLQSVLSEKLKATGEYEEVVPIMLLSDHEITNDGQRRITAKQATKENVKFVLDLLAGRPIDPARLADIANADKLRQAQPEDLIILSFASHGYADEEGRFYFVTYDTGAGAGRAITPDVLQKSISSDELSRWLRDVDAGELVMIVDACQSAAAVEGKGFKPGPMGSRGLGQLAYDKGMRILAATQADNVALEHGLIRQGLLSYALVRDGIELGRADFKPQDKMITLGEWLEYARDRVPQVFAEVRSGQVRGDGPDAPKVILLPQKNAQPNQAGATRLFLQGKPISAAGKLTLAEEQIQRPALFDYSRKRRDVLLLRK
jgi:hypothetical protein